MNHFSAFVFAALILANTSTASIYGSWSGPGRAWDTAGFDTPCDTITVSIESGAGEVALKGITWNCKEAGFEWSDEVYAFREGKLFKDAFEVGTLTETKLILASDSIDLPVEFEFTVKEEGSLTYHEVWKGKDSTFYVDGTLKKVH